MDVPTYSLAERDRRWALARELMAAEEVEALVCYGEHEYVEAAPFAAGIAEVLREHHLEHAAVGVLGLDIVALWHLNPITPYMLSRKVLDELPGVTFKPVGRRFMLATICLSWAFEPRAVVSGRAVNLGGTVILGEDGPIELNPLTAQLLRA